MNCLSPDSENCICLFYNVDDGTVDVMELRPSVELVGFVSRSLFEKYLQNNTKGLEVEP